MNDGEFVYQLNKSINSMDAKSLFAISGACLVEINNRIKTGKLQMRG